MIQTDPNTIDLLSKIKGWHLLHGNSNSSYTDIVKNLVLKDAKRKGLIKNNGGKDDRNNSHS